MDRRRILIAGIGASLVLAMWEMIVEAVIPDGAGFFGPPIAIGATIVRDLQGSANPIPFDVVALVLGLMGHMMNSVILAVIFGLIVTRLAPSDPDAARSLPHPMAPHHDPRHHDRSGGKRQPQAEDKDGRANSGRHEQGDREAARDRDQRDYQRDERIPVHAGSPGAGAPASVPRTRHEVNLSSLSRMMDSASARIALTRGSTS